MHVCVCVVCEWAAHHHHDQDKARQTFEAMVGIGVEEVGCGRPNWIAEFIGEMQ